MQRTNISSGVRWESIVGYSRAVRVGPFVQVAGTTAIGADGALVGVNDAYAQARRCLEVIAWALEQAGAGLADVVRTRIYLTDIACWPEVARAHGEVFASIRPACTMVEVKGLVDPAMLVEIEAEAIASAAPTP